MKKEYDIKLTWSQIWIALTIFITVIGSSFGVGMKVNQELSKITMAKIEQSHFKDLKILRTEHEKEIDKMNEEILTFKRLNQENYQNMIFFRNQYNIYLKRYESLAEDKPYVESVQ